MTDMNVAQRQPVNQRQQAIQCIQKRRQGGQLRTDMAIDTQHLQVRQLGGAGIHGLGVADGDAELVFF